MNIRLLTRRRALSLLLLLIIPVGFIYQSQVNPPDGTFQRAPEGWNVTATTDDLAGLLTAYGSATVPMGLNTTDYARIAAYASEAYWRTRYQSDQPDQASAAFLRVVTNMIPDPDFALRLPSWDRDQTGAADEVLSLAAADGYDKGQPEPAPYVSPLQLGPDRASYTFRSSAGVGNVLERGWGELTPFHQIECSVAPPPISDVADLRREAGSVVELMNAFVTRKDAAQLRSLLDSWLRVRFSGTTQPARVWLEIGSNAAVDAGLSRREADDLLRELAVSIHDTQIATWRAKYHYVLANPIDVAERFPVLSPPYTPSYPSEYASVAGVAALVIERHAPGVQARLEIPGSLISVATTRVLPDMAAARSEAEGAARLIGYDYGFSTEAGRTLGTCMAQEAR